MSDAVLTRMPDAGAVAGMDAQHVAQLLRSQAAQIEALRAQIGWFKRQIFGQKSERYAPKMCRTAACSASPRECASSRA